MDNENKTEDYFQTFKEGFSEFSQKVKKTFDDLMSSDGSIMGELSIPADVYETREHFVIELELPGAIKSDVSVQIVDEELVIKGLKRRRELDVIETYRSQRRYGEFLHHFPLPDYIDMANIKAKYEHGVLRVKFPKTDVDPEDSSEVTID